MEDHSRTIIHIDIDCFYAQVEMVKAPSLKEKPLGIQQKNIVVTSNYVAREYGIKKCMLISEAKKLCPDLLLVNGEDLYNYRQVSYKVTSVLKEYSEIVERLGLDENFIDVTDLVNQKLKCSSNRDSIGYKFGEEEVLCDCGCTERISIGSHIAQQIRNQIYKELGLTVCAGIAHNKLLAKVVGSKNKPNKQTLVFPNSSPGLILSLELVKNIPWIGNVSAKLLSTINITKVNELQNCDIQQLKNIFGIEKAESIWNLSFGIDNSCVKKTGKPQSIGLEDSCKALTSEKEVEQKLKCLLSRLIILIKEDERIPKTIKLTVRKLNGIHPQTSIRETRQCNIDTSFENEAKLMNIIISLFRKMVDTKKMFHVTLLGLSFTKFVEKTHIKNTLTNFFAQDRKDPFDTDFKNQKMISSFTEPTTPMFNDKNYESDQRSHCQKPVANNLANNQAEYCELPVKSYNITAELSNSTDLITKSENKILCPPHANEEVFRELPIDMQEELWSEYKRKRELDKAQRPCKKVKTNSILNYIVRQQK